jgi:hypothetical protein
MTDPSPDSPDELVPNCVTCRQRFEDYGAAMIAGAQQERMRALTSGGPVHGTGGPSVRELVSQWMADFHEEHKPRDN